MMNYKKSVKEWFKSSYAFWSMLLAQIFLTGAQLLSRVVLVQGTFIFALTAYRLIVAGICIAPFALYFERGQQKKFTWTVWTRLFLNGLVGMTMALGLLYYGIRDTSATYSNNFLNLVPICTFLVSIICRMENLGIRTWSGRAKCVGVILCVGGALVASLYKGKEFYIAQHHSHHSVAAHKTHMLRGTLFLVGSMCSYTAWFIIQVKLVEVFPLRYWGTMLSCVMAAIQSIVIGVCIDSSKEAWRLGWNIELITILYSGALATAATFSLLSWANYNQGTYLPCNVQSACSYFRCYIGSYPTWLLGMVLIIVGLCSFLWGKKDELPTNVEANELPTSIADNPIKPESTTTAEPSSST